VASDRAVSRHSRVLYFGTVVSGRKIAYGQQLHDLWARETHALKPLHGAGAPSCRSGAMMASANHSMTPTTRRATSASRSWAARSATAGSRLDDAGSERIPRDDVRPAPRHFCTRRHHLRISFRSMLRSLAWFADVRQSNRGARVAPGVLRQEDLLETDDPMSVRHAAHNRRDGPASRSSPRKPRRIRHSQRCVWIRLHHGQCRWLRRAHRDPRVHGRA
jgi:hypothetical protein